MSKEYIKTVGMTPKIKADFNAKQAPIQKEKRTNEKYISYSLNNVYGRGDDLYPLTLLDTIRASHTATAVCRTRAHFVAGSGASVKEMGEFVVNPKDGTTVNDIINILSKDVVKQKQIYVWVKLDKANGIYSIERLGSQNTRLGLPDAKNTVKHVSYSPFAFGTRENNSAQGNTTKPFYDEKKRAANQIFYVNLDREYNSYYPYPLSEKQFELLRTDAQITSFNYNNLKNNFFGGMVISIVGDPTKMKTVGKNADGTPIQKAFGDIMAEELGRTKVGSDNAGKITLLWTDTDSNNNINTPAIQAVDSNTNADMFNQTLADVTDNIARFFNVPTVLANIQTAGKLGSTDELLNSIDLLNASTFSDRKVIERTLNSFLKRFPEFVKDFKGEPLIIQPLTMIRDIPEKVWSALALEEQRDYIRENYAIELSEDKALKPVKPTAPIPQKDIDELEAVGAKVLAEMKPKYIV